MQRKRKIVQSVIILARISGEIARKVIVPLLLFLLRNCNDQHKTRTTQVGKISQTQLIQRPSKLWPNQAELFI